MCAIQMCTDNSFLTRITTSNLLRGFTGNKYSQQFIAANNISFLKKRRLVCRGAVTKGFVSVANIDLV